MSDGKVDPDNRVALGITYCPVCAVDTIPAPAGWCYFCETQIVGERKPWHYGPRRGPGAHEDPAEARRRSWRLSKRRGRAA